MMCERCQRVLDIQEQVLTLLLEDHKVPTIAQRLATSERVVNRMIADLKAEYSVDSRAQLGYRIGHADGVAGRPDRLAERPVTPS